MYRFTERDLYIGAKLLCIEYAEAGVFSYTVGEIYHVVDVCGMMFPYEVCTDDDDYYVFDLTDFNHPGSSVKFYPVAKMTEKDLFIFRLSGKLPYGV